MNSTLAALRPRKKPQVIELVKNAGFDVSDWANYGGTPGANPKYCYEWCFTQGGLSLVNIWFENLCERDGAIVQDLNLRQRAKIEDGPRRARALRFDKAVHNAKQSRSNLRVIILDRPTVGQGSAERRMLDPQPWHVAAYDEATGAFTLARGGLPSAGDKAWDNAVQEFIEGEIRSRMSLHRKRERAARDAKIEKALKQNNGRLLCEVPGCGFDFFAVYGEAGRGYAHVHHKLPLAELPPGGGKVRLADLAIVCANCHAMIHRGGGCRDMAGLILEKVR